MLRFTPGETMLGKPTQALPPNCVVLLWRSLFVGLILSVAPAFPVAATDNRCIEAVFFDLGDTLVEAAPGGLYAPMPGARQTVDGLRALGKQVGIISNVPPGWTRADLDALMAEPAFLDEFDVLVLSSQAPAAKPDPRIYTHAHGLLPTPVPIAQTAFVGETLTEIANSQHTPTSGARAVGMIGIHLSSDPPSPLADYTIAPDALPAIATLVGNLCPVFGDGFETAAFRPRQ